MPRCRSCGTEIKFIRTNNGKYMPVDVVPVRYRKQEGEKTKIVTDWGEVVSAVLANDMNTADGFGYVPHWSTCLNADQFRRKR